MTSRQRHSGSRALARLVPALTRKAFAERGFHEAALLADWPAIVGENLADKCAAVAVRRDGALEVRAEGPTAIALQHAEPQILDRIATYFGFRAVKRLVLRQGPVLRPRAMPRTARIACPPPPGSVKQAVTRIHDKPLGDALLRLGSRVSDAEESD